MQLSEEEGTGEPISLIEQIRRRPGLFCGCKSLTAFYHFLLGYQTGCRLSFPEGDRFQLEVPSDFHDWAAYRTRFRESTSGWCNMIVDTSASEEDAFDRFFELLDEHSQRVPRLVAEIIRPVSRLRIMREGGFVDLAPPEKVRLIKFTDDPGFFAFYDNKDWRDRFHPYLSWMHGLSGGELVIHDEASYREMIREDEEWTREVEKRASDRI